MKTAAATFSPEDMSIKYVCGIDIGSQSCAGCILRLDKSIVVKPISFLNAREGWKIWEEKLSQLDAEPSQILIGMEATSRYGENLYQELEQRGYVLRLLHSGQTHQFHRQQRLRAKTDWLDAMTIARMLVSGEARAGYVPSEQVTTYRELVRLHTHLSDEAAAYQNEIQALVVVLFPEFTQVFADPCLPNALAVLRAFPSAQAVAEAGVEPLTQVLRAQKPVRYGRPTAQRLVASAKQSVSSGQAVSGRSVSLRILCDQLEHTQANLVRLEAEIEHLLTNDPGVKGVQQIPEFGSKTVAVLRAELGDMQRFTRTEEVIAYGGMDIEIPREREMERQSQAFQTRQWLIATDIVVFRLCVAFICKARLIAGLLSSPGRARSQERFSPDGRHAQDVGGSHPLTQA